MVDYLKSLSHQLQNEPNRSTVSLSDAFRLQFRVKENDNDTNRVERINNVGSDGTDILLKAMVNIMLINVFKKKVAKKSGDFIVHCMMDEIGRLHPNNIKGILQFANSRNIYRYEKKGAVNCLVPFTNCESANPSQSSKIESVDYLWEELISNIGNNLDTDNSK